MRYDNYIDNRIKEIDRILIYENFGLFKKIIDKMRELMDERDELQEERKKLIIIFSISFRYFV